MFANLRRVSRISKNVKDSKKWGHSPQKWRHSGVKQKNPSFSIFLANPQLFSSVLALKKKVFFQAISIFFSTKIESLGCFIFSDRGSGCLFPVAYKKWVYSLYNCFKCHLAKDLFASRRFEHVNKMHMLFSRM